MSDTKCVKFLHDFSCVEAHRVEAGIASLVIASENLDSLYGEA